MLKTGSLREDLPDAVNFLDNPMPWMHFIRCEPSIAITDLKYIPHRTAMAVRWQSPWRA
jgi:hypothetical protein